MIKLRDICKYLLAFSFYMLLVPIPGIIVLTLLCLFICTIIYFIAEKKGNILRQQFIFILLFVYVVILSIQNNTSFIHFLPYFWGLVIVNSFFLFKTKDELFKFIENVLIVFILCLIPIVFFEMLTGIHYPRSKFVINGYMSIKKWGLFVPTACFTNENDLASFLANASFCLFYLHKNSNKTIIKIVISISIFITIITDSRGALLSYIVFFLFLLFLNKKNLKKRNLQVIILLLLIICVTYKLIVPYFISLFSTKSQKSDLIRIHLIIQGISDVFLNKNYLGRGPYGFQKMMITNNNIVGNIIDPHFAIIEILVNFGIPISFFLFLFFCKYFQITWKEDSCLFICLFLFIWSTIETSSFVNSNWNWFFWGFYYHFFFIKKKVLLLLRMVKN